MVLSVLNVYGILNVPLTARAFVAFICSILLCVCVLGVVATRGPDLLPVSNDPQFLGLSRGKLDTGQALPIFGWKVVPDEVVVDDVPQSNFRRAE